MARDSKPSLSRERCSLTLRTLLSAGGTARAGNVRGRLDRLRRLEGSRPLEDRCSSPAPRAACPSPARPCPDATGSGSHLADKHVVLDAPVVTDEVPDGYEVALFGLGCFWGAEEIYWQLPGRVVHERGLRRRRDGPPVVRGGLLGDDRAHRGRARRLRPDRGQLRDAGEAVLRGPRPDPGHAPGQRRRHAVPLRDLHHRRRAGRDRRAADEGVRRRAGPSGPRRDHHRGAARPDVLLRRGPAPAVPRQEPLRLPVPRQHRQSPSPATRSEPTSPARFLRGGLRERRSRSCG